MRGDRLARLIVRFVRVKLNKNVTHFVNMSKLWNVMIIFGTTIEKCIQILSTNMDCFGLLICENKL